MKIKKTLLALCLIASGQAMASPLSVADFENYAIGTKLTMWNRVGDAITSTATVEADPTNPNNKVLHIVVKDWDTYPEFTLTDLVGPAVTNRYTTVRCKYYRSTSETDAYKQFAVFLGSDEIYRDDSYPYKGDAGAWQNLSYGLGKATASNTSNKLRLGIHHSNSDYYIDDITLVGEFDDYLTPEDGAVLNYCQNNSSDNYVDVSQSIFVTGGRTVNVRTSRYSNWTGKVAGTGRLNIYAGGERSYIGNKSTPANWPAMTGDVHLYPYKEVCASAGFYGSILSSGTFSPDNLDTGNPNRAFQNCSLTMHDGTTMASESGTRGIYIGELNLESGATIKSYYKSGKSAKTYYVIGGNNTNATLAGKIDNGGNSVGLIKIGTGTYTITGNSNNIGGGIRVNSGTMLFANNATAAAASKLTGATGVGSGIQVFEGATVGGNGSVATNVTLYGTLTPGINGIGTLAIANYASTESVSLKATPTSKLRFQIGSTNNYDRLEVAGALSFSNQTQDFSTSDRKPRVYIELADTASLAVGNEFVLISAKSKALFENAAWQFDIRYPKSYTWEVEERTSDGQYSLVARVTSLNYSMQGETKDDDEEEEGFTPITEDGDADGFNEQSDNTSLRAYAADLGKHIGVAAASYRYDISSDSNSPTNLVASQFNMIVAENEMKFDATEPERNSFSFGGADAIMALAERNHQAVRGHTLAWHSQVAGWVSSDGKKNNNNFTRAELQSILKNHIETVVGRYKGRIAEWDVVNEVLDDDQSIIRTNSTSYKLRPSIWATYIGEDFIDSAFVWAHRVDPQAKLYINEYGVEFAGNAKTEAYYNLIKRLRSSGIPVDGCGLQCHITTGELDTLRLSRNISRYEKIGLNCIITELDIALADPSAENALEIQAAEYAAITKVFLSHANCPNLMIWGISDNHSWRKNQPLLYNSALQAKPAYYGVHAALRRRKNYLLDVDTPLLPAASEVRRIDYFSLDGKRLYSQPSGFSVMKTTYTNGTTDSKVVVK